MKRAFIGIGLALGLVLFQTFTPSWIGQIAYASPSRDSSFERLAHAIQERTHRVQEFNLIREAAQELGMRVWLFGGTAAGFAHYVRWDLAREAGDTRYLASRFDYEFTQIYRSTQDADLVVDGTPEQATHLENLIRERLSHLQGAKEDWEVRLLRHERDGKIALLNNPDFLNQHTDSNSTGMIELTLPSQGESAVRDLRDWRNVKRPQFLRDVVEGKIHYYFSTTHNMTRYFKEGLNPPIFSVIRYFTKAFQYELHMRDDELPALKKIIESFDCSEIMATSRTQARFEKIGSRLILHASNIEYAWNTLESLGLRKKLMDCSDPRKKGTLGWWLNKEPLRTKPVGQGGGKTLAMILREPGEESPEQVMFAHEAADFLAWESISRDTTGRPNVLISRKGFEGETAAHGDGHYTQIGRLGAAGTGFTIRYHADLNAREGSDFLVHDNYFVWINRSAIRVIPESLEFDPLSFFKLLATGKGIDKSERGILEKLRRRSKNRLHGNFERQFQEIRELVESNLTHERKELILEWLEWDLPGKEELIRRILTEEHAYLYDGLFSRILRRQRTNLSPSLLRYMVDLNRFDIDHHLVRSILSEDLEKHAELIDVIVSRGSSDVQLAEHVLGRPRIPRADWIETVLNRGSVDVAELFVKHERDSEVFRSRPDLIQKVLDAGSSWIDTMISNSPRIISLYPHLVSRLIRKRHSDHQQRSIDNYLIGWFADYAPREYMFEWAQIILERGLADHWMVGYFVTRAGRSPETEQIVLTLLERGSADYPLITLLTQAAWSDRPEWIRTIIRRTGEENIPHILFQLENSWGNYPELILELIQRPEPIGRLNSILQYSKWRHSPLLRKLCGDKDPTVELLENALRSCDSLLDSTPDEPEPK